jgi:2-polyprenyl-3-methyl-5-hydroxy-6-metoxy-1,4-benzoquinol methylase
MIKVERAEKNQYYYDKAYKDAKHYKAKFNETVYYPVWKYVGYFMPDDKNTKIVDVGCGTGQLLDMFYSLGYRNISGFDFSHVACQIANENYDYLDITHGDLYDTVIDADVVLCTEVLEHIERDCEMLESWDVNQVIITVPDFNDPSHLRYFEDCQDVESRYGKYFKRFETIKVKSWYILNGFKK